MQDPYLHIEDYINGQLSKEDKLSFENAMQSDTQLRQAVEDFDLLGLIGEALVEDEIAGIVDSELGKESDREKDKKQERSIKYLRWAAAASAILVLGWWGSTLLPEKSPEQIFAEAYEEPAWPTERSGNDDAIQEYIALYQAGKQSSAKDSLTQLNTNEGSYWLSEIYLLEQKPDSTLLHLELDLSTDTKRIRDRKLYIHILALYISGDQFRAKTAYKSLPKDVDGWYLERLHKLWF